MCELKGETPQEGINRQQSGDRVRHGGQMGETERDSVCFPVLGRGWAGLGYLIRESQSDHMAHY